MTFWLDRVGEIRHQPEGQDQPDDPGERRQVALPRLWGSHRVGGARYSSNGSMLGNLPPKSLGPVPMPERDALISQESRPARLNWLFAAPARCWIDPCGTAALGCRRPAEGDSAPFNHAIRFRDAGPVAGLGDSKLTRRRHPLAASTTGPLRGNDPGGRSGAFYQLLIRSRVLSKGKTGACRNVRSVESLTSSWRNARIRPELGRLISDREAKVRLRTVGQSDAGSSASSMRRRLYLAESRSERRPSRS